MQDDADSEAREWMTRITAPGLALEVRHGHKDDAGAEYVMLAMTGAPNLAQAIETFFQDRKFGERCGNYGRATAAARFSIDFSASFMVGDRCSDIVAGRSVGCYTLFVDRGYDRCTDVKPDAVVRSLRQAVQHILSRTAPPGKDSPT